MLLLMNRKKEKQLKRGAGTKRDAETVVVRGKEGEKGEVLWSASFRFQCGSCFEQDGTNGLTDTVTSRNPS